MPSLTLPDVIDLLADQVAAIADQQVDAPGHRHSGGIVSLTKIGVGSGLPEVGATSDFAAACGYLYIAARRADDRARPEDLVTRATRGVDFLLRSQRPGGLIDLVNCNYDSAPDTGFCVQMLVPLLQLGADLRADDPAWDTFCRGIEEFARRATPGLASGGFHTPNHRWVIASALTLTARFVPGVSAETVATAIDPLLAEGIDIDAEGAFIERSVGVYDAVCDRSLLFLGEFWPAAHSANVTQAAVANLGLDLHLLDPDGTAETGLSHRQDYGTRAVPVGLVPCYLLAGRTEAGASRRAEFDEAAHFLWARARRSGEPLGVPALNWLAHALLTLGDKVDAFPSGPAHPPVDFVRHFPLNKFWRARRGAFAITTFADTTRLLHLTFGSAELAGLKISQSYFGAGLFVAEQLTGDASGAVLRSSGLRIPRRPGYELPLGSPVPAADWEKLRPARPLRPIPPAAGELALRLLPGDGGQGTDLELCYRTTDGLDGVTTQIALDFAPGGIWESSDTLTRPAAGQVLFLKQGSARMRYGLDVIEIEGGAHAHAMWAMRDSETAPAHVRVLLTFLTPVEHRFRLKTRHGL